VIKKPKLGTNRVLDIPGKITIGISLMQKGKLPRGHIEANKNIKNALSEIKSWTEEVRVS